MREFVDLYNLINLIKTTTCFKGIWACIDLLLTNQKYSFKIQTHLKLASVIIFVNSLNAENFFSEKWAEKIDL